MTVASTLPAVMPNRSMTRAELVVAMDDWIETWPDFAAAIDDVVLAFNFNSTNATSIDSLLIEKATKSLNVGAGKSFVPGMAITCAYTTDPTRWMRGEVITYNSGTGALVFDSRYISDNVGTYAAWTISLAAIEASVEDSNILCVTGNGHGSTDTYIRLLTTTTYNTGTAFTVVHSATLGTYITINEPGVYSFTARDSRAGSLLPTIALTKNAAVLTGSPVLTECLGHIIKTSVGSNGASGLISVTDRLNTGDVIRLQDANLNDGGAGSTSIWGRKIGNV